MNLGGSEDTWFNAIKEFSGLDNYNDEFVDSGSKKPIENDHPHYIVNEDLLNDMNLQPKLWIDDMNIQPKLWIDEYTIQEKDNGVVWLLIKLIQFNFKFRYLYLWNKIKHFI